MPVENMTHHANAESLSEHYRSVLLIDDDSYSQQFMQCLLEDLGLSNIFPAKDGHSAMRYFDSLVQKPDLIVCDLYMPDMDGIEVLNELGRRKYAGDIVLMTSGDLTILEVAAQVAEGGNHLHLLRALAKPVTLETLENALRWQN